MNPLPTPHRLALLAGASLALALPLAADPANDVPRAQWRPAAATQNGEFFVMPDNLGGLAIEGPGKVVADGSLPGGKAIEFTALPTDSTNSPARQPRSATAFKVSGNLAVEVHVKPAPALPNPQGESIVYLYTCFEIRYRRDRGGYSAYVWSDPKSKSPVQVFVPAPNTEWHTVTARVVGDQITLDVNGNTATGTGTLRAATTSVSIGYADRRPFTGRIGDITLSEPGP